MKQYRVPMVPGPTSVSREVLEAGMIDFGSADLEEEYAQLYVETTGKLQEIMGTGNEVVLGTGEGMAALWGAMKSCVGKGDRVLVLSTGLFGYGMGSIAESAGAEVRTVGFGWDETLEDFWTIERAIEEFRPKMITMVQNETPSGTMNPVAEIGRLKKKWGIPLLYVDAVSGIGGSEVKVDEWGVDLCLGGSQKCLGAPASMSFVSVSGEAWRAAEQIGYAGYDALLPWRGAAAGGLFPYTPYWQGTAQLAKACGLLLEEGLVKAVERHARVAEYCRGRIEGMGLKLYPKEEAVKSPTVTAVRVPEEMEWKVLDGRLRERGVVMGGNYGCLEGEVFRVGHMGRQANMNWVKEAMDVLEEVIRL